jgi:hypothetical protein
LTSPAGGDTVEARSTGFQESHPLLHTDIRDGRSQAEADLRDARSSSRAERGYNTIFRGQRLTVRTPPASDLVIGKLKRLDPEDFADVTFLIRHFRLTEEDLKQSFDRLPARFKADPVVQDNLRFIVEDLL